MENEQFTFNIDVEGSEVIIRQGEALPLKRALGFSVSGKVGSCQEFSKKRKPLKESTYVCVDRKKGVIEMVVGDVLPKEEQIVISDHIYFHDHLIELGIESKKWSDPAQLGDLLRRRKRYFSNMEEGLKIISALKNFIGKVNTQLEKIDDKHSGQYRQVVDKIVESNLPESFILNMPVLEGFQSKEFKVDLLIDVRDRAVSLWLESPELEEIIETSISEVIDKELAYLSDHYTVIEI